MEKEQYFYVFDNKPEEYIPRDIDFGADKNTKFIYDRLIDDYQKCVNDVLCNIAETKEHFGYNLKMFIQSMNAENKRVNTSAIAREIGWDTSYEKEIRKLYAIADYNSLKDGSCRKDFVETFCEDFSISKELLIHGCGEIYELDNSIVKRYVQDCNDTIPINEHDYVAKWYYYYEGNNPYKEVPRNMSYDEKLKYEKNRKKYQNDFKMRKRDSNDSFIKNLKLYEEYLKTNGLIQQDVPLLKKRWAVMCKSGIYIGLSEVNKKAIKILIKDLYGIQIKAGMKSNYEDEFINY